MAFFPRSIESPLQEKFCDTNKINLSKTMNLEAKKNETKRIYVHDTEIKRV